MSTNNKSNTANAKAKANIATNASNKWAELRTLKLEDLHINPKYQRPLNRLVN